MQKGYFFFLVFVLASAVILGSTIGLISNVSYVIQHRQMQEHKTTDKTSPEDQMDEEDLISDSDINVAKNDDSYSNAEDSIANYDITPPSNSDIEFLTTKGKALIELMLFSMGMKDRDDMNQFIMDFQKKHALTPTGKLDSATVDTVIKQTNLQRSANSLNCDTNI